MGGKIHMKRYWISAAVLGLSISATNVLAEEIAIAVHVAPVNEMYRVAERIKAEIEEVSGGDYQVVVLGKEVGGERDQLEATSAGEYQITLGGSVPMSLYAPEYAAADLPFIWSSSDEARKIYEGDLGAAVQELFGENGNLHLLGLSLRTPRNLTSNTPITSPEDIKGARLRVPEIPAWVEVWSAVGALPSPVAWPEVYTSLQTGVIQMQENPVSPIYSGKLYEVQDYINVTEHVYSFFHWLANDEWFAKLSAEDQKMIQTAVNNAIAWGDDETINGAASLLQTLKDEGMEVVEPDKAAFREMAKPAIRSVADGYAPAVREYVLSTLN
jgi:tripartite ATP-independent transporter DctP family solute receptor